ncbi:1-phosphofructokinase [Halalkalicoccus jeotgali]|uniref:1-phosphofructokinase n=1 Tax=Halalkalicoccus jeotgali (strain DSM 18796 / CECT 7217 / JCM 14584 / KCTC 4019 / B3) TaxID=795797 RepID=D8J427_HALJB|nr:1-phosphofructokinase [Halalkalicoccus jeotgali]ADJ15419.1 1-phosphofructokinase [Halalkalicoccus jeotgali B3]ELY35805.1 1-phosphofructokinase [Halalkalicoccus jeotgali B3]
MILTVTLNPAVDHTLELGEALEPAAVARTDAATFDPGGKGINVSKYLVELEAETLASGYVGGFLGRFLTTALDERGIPNDFVEIDDGTRLNTTILTPGAEYKINQDGPTVEAGAIEAVVETIRRYEPETVLVAGSLPPGLDAGAIDAVARAGPWKTVVDVDGPLLSSLEAAYALCKPNREELAAATGEPTTTVEECVAAARSLRNRGFDRVVASLGSDGAVMVSPDRAVHVPALDADVADTVGAGDALLAGVLSERHRGRSDEAALRTGVAVASRVVSVPGTGVPPFEGVRSDVDRSGVDVV